MDCLEGWIAYSYKMYELGFKQLYSSKTSYVSDCNGLYFCVKRASWGAAYCIYQFADFRRSNELNAHFTNRGLIFMLCLVVGKRCVV